MTIDEKLARLTERHEALTLTVELMDHQIERVVTAVAGLVTAVTELHAVAQSHERRIGRLEEGS